MKQLLLWVSFFVALYSTAYLIAQKFISSRLGPPLTNYEDIIYYDPAKVLTPSSLQDIQDIIKKAQKTGQKIRPLGSGHSWNTMALSNDILLSLYNYRGLVSVDKEKKQITVLGGTRLWEINQYAHQHGLALSILPSISNQTIGGALATGTHGSGVKFGNMASYVTELEMVTGTGTVLTLTPKDDDLFQAAGVSLGLLGIITEVTLQCEKAFNLHEIRSKHSLEYCMNHMTSIATNGQHVKLWIELVSGTCLVYTVKRTTEKPRDLIPQPKTDILAHLYEVVQFVWSVLPMTAGIGMNMIMNNLEEHDLVDHSWGVFNIPHYVDQYHRESEVAVPFKDCVRGIKDVIKVKEEHNIPLSHIIEVRFVKRDTFWLSNNYHQDSCHITLLLHNPSDYYFNLYTDNVFKATLQYGGRPHWGKVINNLSPDKGRSLYPKFDDFLNLYKELDPDRVFLNEFVQKIFYS